MSRVIEVRPILADLYALPKGEIAGDLFGGLFGGWIGPNSILVYFTIDDEIEIARLALPMAGALFLTRLQKFHVDRIGREILISLDLNGLIGLGNGRAVPDCLCHYRAPCGLELELAGGFFRS